MQTTEKRPLRGFLLVQFFVATTTAAAIAALPRDAEERLHETVTGAVHVPEVRIPRQRPLSVTPLYNDPEVVTDEELAAVLSQIRPRFSREQLRPNHVEHALRTWGVDATFEDPDVLSGAELRDVLIDHGKFLASWSRQDATRPLLLERPQGVAVRWGKDPDGSVHHDHWLASLTEAGVPREQPLFTPTRNDMTIEDALQEALRDFRVDERETEWSAMAFGLWLPPLKEWKTADGRTITFDLLARRLMRGDRRFGVCSGTHRVYSLLLLVRLDDEFRILSRLVRDDVWAHLESIRDLITVSQWEDGRWPSNWSAGRDAVETPIDEPDYKQVIATGHHLEWLSIAPKELHPPRAQILKAAEWIIRNTVEQTPDEIREKYTFYSHVGAALANWRSVRPADFWRTWQGSHP